MVKDNKQMTDTLAKLTDERRLLQERVTELENQHPENVNYNELEERVMFLFVTKLATSNNENFRQTISLDVIYVLKVIEKL